MSVTVSGGSIPDARLVPILGPSRSHPGSEVVPSRFAMCFVLQCFGPIQVPRWGPSQPVLVPSCSRAFLTGSGLDGQKQTSWPLPNKRGGRIKFLPRGASKYTSPPPSPENAFGPKMGGRGGGVRISPRIFCRCFSSTRCFFSLGIAA